LNPSIEAPKPGYFHYRILLLPTKVQRMCFSCSNYENKNGKHFCKLLQLFLKENELRIDCPDHIEK